MLQCKLVEKDGQGRLSLCLHVLVLQWDMGISGGFHSNVLKMVVVRMFCFFTFILISSLIS